MENFRKIICLFLIILSSASFAGDGSGAVKQVMAHEGDLFIFQTQNHSNPPSCNNWGWAVSLATESGKAMYSLVLSAQAQKKSITVRGTGSCTDWPDRETPRYIYITD